MFQIFKDAQIEDITNYPFAKLFTYEIYEYTNGYWLNNNIGTLDQTYFFHANHVVGETNKINLLKKAKKWID